MAQGSRKPSQEPEEPRGPPHAIEMSPMTKYDKKSIVFQFWFPSYFLLTKVINNNIDNHTGPRALRLRLTGSTAQPSVSRRELLIGCWLLLR